MARLNDPPQPSGETVDALKRRFVRQNRELARVNSTQSVRIRNLESEVSRLLAENVSLREQVIKLHYEVENSPGRSAWEKVDSLKHRLETRLTELGGLLQELEDVQSSATKGRPVKRKSTSRASPKRSPNQRNWKTAITLSDITGEGDGRLPPILEDKFFPRRTLEGNEIQGMLTNTNNLTDSPDLGPPPVAHFEEEDPIKFDATSDKPRSDEISATALSAHLETRKKRRESFHQRETSRKRDGTDLEGRAIPPDEKAAPGQTLKSGAKRKLTLREDEELPMADLNPEDFRFNRKPSDSEHNPIKPQSASKGRGDNSKENGEKDANLLAAKQKPKKINAVAPSIGRKALGPKSVNSDPQSPAKLDKGGAKTKLLEDKGVLVKPIRDRHVNSDQHNTTSYRKIVKQAEIPKDGPAKTLEPPPKTPVPLGLDLFSPTASDPSEPRPEARDTPPPPDLGPDTGTGSFGRGSRRSRGSVSYAEPNLRDKMRRPTKGMVDAVGGEEKSRQAANAESAGDVSSSDAELERLGLNSTIIKEEDERDVFPLWNTKAPDEGQAQTERQRRGTASPLGMKSIPNAGDLPPSVITDRRRRASSISRKQADCEQVRQSSGAATAIAALAGAGPKAQRRREGDGGRKDAEGEEGLVESGERTSIFDFTGSSPEDLDQKITSKEEREEAAEGMRISRRHSSVGANWDDRNGSIAISRRKRETILDDGEAGKVESAEGSKLKSAKSTMSLAMCSAEDGRLSRGERAANRRRSMML